MSRVDPAAEKAPASAVPASPPLWRRVLAELLGTGLLVAIVIGSGIAAQRLAPEAAGTQLLAVCLVTGLGLAVLILILQPVSGAQLNPVVTAADRALGTPLTAGTILAYVTAQLGGGFAGAILANAMFEEPTSLATAARLNPGAFLGEVVATAGLVLTIVALARTGRLALVAPAVGAYIAAAHWFTSSTSFANPAVTAGRVLSDTFAGIAPSSAAGFVAAQLLGAAIGVVLVLALFPARRRAVTGPS